MVPAGYPLDHVVRASKEILFAGAPVESGSIAYNKRQTVCFCLCWIRTFINLAPMHSTATSPVPISGTIDSLTAKPSPWFPFFSCFRPSAREQNTTYLAAVKALFPSRLTSCNPTISQRASSKVFRITSACPMPFVPLKASLRTLYVPTTS